MRTPEEEALTRIRQAAETGATTLDLSRLGLTALPPEIGQLVSLQRLDLSLKAHHPASAIVGVT